MTDRFSSNAPSLTGPATQAFAITPDNLATLPEATRAVYVGTGGALAVRMLSGQTVVFTGLGDGTILPVRIDRVLATGTTATALLGLA